MNDLLVTYADGSTERVPSDLTPDQFFDSRFGGLEEETRAKCKVEIFTEEPVKAKAKK